MRSVTVALCVAVILAGCGGTLADERTRTPTAIPVPGVSAAGVDAPERLAAAHRASIRGRSYTLKTQFRVLGPNDSVRFGMARTLRVGPNGTFRYEQRVTGTFPGATGPPDELFAYSDGNRTFVRSADGDEVVYRLGMFDREARIITGRSAIRIYLAGLRGAVERIDDSGRINYRISGTVAEEAEGSVGGARVVAVVDSFGFLSELHVSEPAGFWMDARVTRSLRYDAIGMTTVTRPAWIDEAQNATAVATGTLGIAGHPGGVSPAPAPANESEPVATTGE